MSFAAIASAFSLALAAASSLELSGEISPAAHAHPATLVRIEETRRLNMWCIGTGSPVVLLEAGLGGGVPSWSKAQGQIAAFTRVCSYDRSGYRFSDPSPRSSTALNVANDLERLIVAANLETPVVLVGHSLGGLFVTVFADKHPEQVAGMVLIDPSAPGKEEALSRAETPEQAKVLGDILSHQQDKLRRCAALQRKKPQPLGSECANAGAMLSEFEAGWGGENSKEANAAYRRLNVPLVVLTAVPGDSLPNLPPASQENLRRVLREGQQRMASQSRLGQWRAVPNSGHYIQNDQPQSVVDSVREVVEAARTASANHP